MLKQTLGYIIIITIWVVRVSPTKSLDGRIVGGEDADIADYPYQLSLQVSSTGFHFCGAVILSSSWAATAGHCIYIHRNTALSVRAGSSKISTGGQLINITASIIHPLYNETTIDYDIALIKLKEEISTDNASPVTLPGTTTNPVAEGKTAVITGWGRLAEHGDHPKVLQVVEVPVIARNDCVTAYSEEYITRNMFCAGFLGVGEKDACTGDSGGPVIIDGQLSGIVSWGIGCAEAQHPGVYTNVFNFVDWIHETINYYY